MRIEDKPTKGEELQISGMELQKYLKEMSELKNDNSGDSVL